MKLNLEKCAFGVESSKFLGFLISNRGIKANPIQIKEIENIPPNANNSEGGDETDQKDSGAWAIHIPLLREVPQNLCGPNKEQKF